MNLIIILLCLACLASVIAGAFKATDNFRNPPPNTFKPKK